MTLTMTNPGAACGAAARAEHRGTPASRGQATGPARILREAADVGRLSAGDIAVVASAAPVWTSLLSLAAGVITETGGALSSLAVAAREYGIPAVVGVHNATIVICDGQIVTIDGATGMVLAPTR